MATSNIAARNKAAKRRGAAHEIDILNTLREHGFDADRLNKTGKDDEGDLVVRHDGGHTIIEAKNEKQINLAGYMKEVEVEVENFIKHRPHLNLDKIKGVAVVKARGKNVLDSYVVMPMRTYFGIAS